MMKSFMSRKRSNRIISWILLGYFAFFIVPPISTFAASDQGLDAFVAEAGSRLVQAQGQAPLFLFDVILWQNLKKTRHSEEFLVSFFPGDCGPTGTCTSGAVALVQFTFTLSGQVTVLGHIPPLCQSRSSSIRFSKSGISPPTVSL